MWVILLAGAILFLIALNYAYKKQLVREKCYEAFCIVKGKLDYFARDKVDLQEGEKTQAENVSLIEVIENFFKEEDEVTEEPRDTETDGEFFTESLADENCSSVAYSESSKHSTGAAADTYAISNKEASANDSNIANSNTSKISLVSADNFCRTCSGESVIESCAVPHASAAEESIDSCEEEHVALLNVEATQADCERRAMGLRTFTSLMQQPFANLGNAANVKRNDCCIIQIEPEPIYRANSIDERTVTLMSNDDSKSLSEGSFLDSSTKSVQCNVSNCSTLAEDTLANEQSFNFESFAEEIWDQHQNSEDSIIVNRSSSTLSGSQFELKTGSGDFILQD